MGTQREAPLELVEASEQRLNRIFVTAVAICLLLQGWLIFRLEINWDEFSYLSQIYDYQRGEMGKAFQVFHVHFFGWLTRVSANEVDQVIAGRVIMLAFVAGTCALTYQLARAFFSKGAALVAVLAFASAGPTIIHGASFRTDPMGAALIMAALVAMTRGKPALAPMLLSAVFAALAAMITIKVGLYAPAFAGVAAWRLCAADDRRAMLRWLIAVAIATAAVFALLYFLQLSLVAKASNAGSQAMLGNAARVQFLEYGFLPRSTEIWRAALISPVQSILIGAGMVGVLAAFARSSPIERCRPMAIAGCGATLICLIFYRNAFPYFFAFIIPPAMLLVAWIVEWSSLLRSRIGLSILCALMVADAVLVAIAWSGRERPPQREVVAAVHEIFPEPVLMIDHSHMIGSFPKRGFFMSTWGMAGYRGNPPRFRQILQQEAVPLLLLDSPRLAEAVGAAPEMQPSNRLQDEDRTVLRQNYIHHWGPVWVAGKQLRPNGPSGEFEIFIPGTYTLEGEALAIDAKQVPGGGTIQLERGQHRFSAQSKSPRNLRWGNHLSKPSGPEPTGPLFVGF